jgi:hypothetical protein
VVRAISRVSDTVWALCSFRRMWHLGHVSITGRMHSRGSCGGSHQILAMSFIPRDSHKAQVQFALERGDYWGPCL